MTTLSMRNVINEISNQADLENDIRWINEGDIQYLILMLDVTHGSWITLVKGKAGAKVPVHYHPNGLHVFTISGHWRYLEHDWEARAGHFLYEAPGEVHTPIFMEDTLLYSMVDGAIIYLDSDRKIKSMADVHTSLAAVREHYQKIGLSEKDVQLLVR